MEDKRPLRSIPDDELLHRLAELMGQARRVDADVVAEVDERRLYAREALPSMFAYCTAVLHFSEAEAYLRIAAARASREHPTLLVMLADGRLHLSGIERLAPHLTRENRDGLLERATHRTKRQIEELIAEIAPRPDIRALVRRLPERRTPPSSGLPLVPSQGEAPELRLDGVVTPPLGPLQAGDLAHAAAPRVSPAVIQPLSPGRYKVQFTASAELDGKLERLRALIGSKATGGDLAAVIEQAVTEKLERLEAKRFARTRVSRKVLAKSDPSRSGRHIPAAVRRAVRERDGERCRYLDDRGRRCPERYRLEFHHVRPFGLGGDHSVENLRLMCRGHNAYLADCDFSRGAMARHRRPGRRGPQAAAG